MNINTLMMEFEDKNKFKRLTKELSKLDTVDFLQTLYYHFETSIPYTTLVQLFEKECKKRDVNYHVELNGYNFY